MLIFIKEDIFIKEFIKTFLLRKTQIEDSEVKIIDRTDVNDRPCA